MMQDWLSTQAHNTPRRTALTVQGETYTYAALNQQVALYAARLAHVGVRAEDRIAILLPNIAEAVILIHAVMRLQAVLVPINSRLTPHEINWQLEHSQAKLIIHSQANLSETPCQALSLEDLKHTPSPNLEAYLSGQIDLSALCAIIHTSGTSGKPKSVLLSYGNFFYSAMASAYRLGTLPDDNWLCVMPLYHVGGLSIIMRAALYGITISLYPRFDTETINTALTQNNISLISLVPTMLYRLLQAKTAPWSGHLRLVLLGGAAASTELISQCQAENIPIALTYGLSEATSQVATMLPEDVYRKPGSVGKPLSFTQVRIMDDQGQPCTPGQYGEIVVSGPTVMLGYDQIAPAPQPLHTGDIGYLDDEGDLWIVQRRSDLIITGGENVYPLEVESVLKEHPAVLDACVVGLPSTEWGQQVAAAVILKPDHRVDMDTLSQFTRQHLAGYKQPRYLQVVEDFPRTSSGKIQRHEIIHLMEQTLAQHPR
jgi:O-succinylbenzoic acid--CoA ligase